MNNWSFTGNLGKDCEVSTTQGGKTVCKFSVAVKSGFGDNSKTTWVNCRLYGKRAEGQLPQYLTKGQHVAVTGECELAEWESNGVNNKALMLMVNGLDLIGEKQAAQQNTGYQQQAPQQQGGYQQPNNGRQQQTPQQQTQGHGGYQMDDDIGF
jgi:single-strand DNA-binding protein